MSSICHPKYRERFYVRDHSHLVTTYTVVKMISKDKKEQTISENIDVHVAIVKWGWSQKIVTKQFVTEKNNRQIFFTFKINVS